MISASQGGSLRLTILLIRDNLFYKLSWNLLSCNSKVDSNLSKWNSNPWPLGFRFNLKRSSIEYILSKLKYVKHLTSVGTWSWLHIGIMMNLWRVSQVKPLCKIIASWSGTTVNPLWQITVHCICPEKLGRGALLAMCFANVTDDKSCAVVRVWVQATFSIFAEIWAGWKKNWWCASQKGKCIQRQTISLQPMKRRKTLYLDSSKCLSLKQEICTSNAKPPWKQVVRGNRSEEASL